MSAIFKREIKSYFCTPVGYIVLTVFYFILGILFSMLYSSGSPQINYIFQHILMIVIVMLVVPVITMRTMSEDRRQKVDQVLLTAPVNLVSIVLGKYLAALLLFALAFAPTVIFELIIISYVKVNVLTYLYSLLGMLLLGSSLIAIGIFISSLTESSVVSAILSIVVNIWVLLMSGVSDMISVPTDTAGFFQKIWAKIVEYIIIVLDKTSFMGVYQGFGENIFSIPDIIYFLSVTAMFLFLCVRSLEKRRWS